MEDIPISPDLLIIALHLGSTNIVLNLSIITAGPLITCPLCSLLNK